MQDRVAEVLAQRALLDRGASGSLLLSVLLHGSLTAAGVYAALRTPASGQTRMVSIQFAKMPAASAATITKPAVAKPVPRTQPPQPRIEEPKPVAARAPQVDKHTVPLSPFGRSTKKGSEAPDTARPVPPPPAADAVEVPIGGSGVAGLEGGDFPYTLYIQGMHRKIGANWFRPQVAAGTAVVLYYRIQRDGRITDARVETASGNTTFDRAALSAVRSSSPLNPLPFGYSGNYLGVHLIFR